MKTPDDARMSAQIDQAHAMLRDYVEGVLLAVHMRRKYEDDTNLTLDLAVEIDRGPYTHESLCCMLAIALVETDKARCPR